MFQLSAEEADSLRFRFGSLKRGQHYKYLPFAFTEQGVAMLSGVLRSHRAVQTAWLSLNQMAELFDRDKSVISKHIKNIFEEGELKPDSVVANFATTAADGFYWHGET